MSFQRHPSWTVYGFVVDLSRASWIAQLSTECIPRSLSRYPSSRDCNRKVCRRLATILLDVPSPVESSSSREERAARMESTHTISAFYCEEHCLSLAVGST
mmetsp:Transcript_32489/g.59599  ORF Transcript_32489/g.59599 Transcript_32489/m.59599 type:complete len:101 (-) Transcript_32489:129-431(-)